MKKIISFDQIKIDNDIKKNNDIKKDKDNDIKKDIAVIGMACKFPMADEIDDFWNILKDEVECIREFPQNRKMDIEKYLEFSNRLSGEPKFSKAGFLDELDQFDYRFFNMTPNEAKVMDPNHKIFLQTAWSAIEDSGYGGDKLKGSRTGVYVGYKAALSNVYQNYIEEVQPNLIPISIFGNKPPMMASRISYFLDLKGPSMIIDTACSATLVALHLACGALKSGECDTAIVGSCKIIAVPIEGLDETIGIESCEYRTRTFDDNSSGTCPGEGAGAVILKPLHKALEDGDNIYAVIRGSAINQNGHSSTIAAPSADAQADVITRAWMDAGVNPESISYIETHGTATKLGDPIEIEGLKKAFEKFTDRKQFCAVGAVKTNIGHLDNSSSIAGFIKTVLALKNKQLPATLNFSVPNRNIDFINSPIYVNYKHKSWKNENHEKLRCGISGVGLNGTNCHVVLEETPIHASNLIYKERADLFTLSAKSASSLEEYIKKYKKYVSNQNLNIEDIAFTQNSGKGDYEYRIAFSFESKEEWKSKIERLNSICLEENCEEDGIYYNKLDSDNINGKVVDEFIKEGKKDKVFMEELCKLYVSGGLINWDRLYAGEGRKKVSTPTYPFERTRSWVEVPNKKNPEYMLDRISSIFKNEAIPEEILDQLRAALQNCRDYIDSNYEEDMPIQVSIQGPSDHTFSDIEYKVAAIWADMFGYTEIDITHTLFDLGGDSILALKIINRINNELDTNLKAVDLLKNPTIERISKMIVKR